MLSLSVPFFSLYYHLEIYISCFFSLLSFPCYQRLVYLRRLEFVKSEGLTGVGPKKIECVFGALSFDFPSLSLMISSETLLAN